MSQARAAKVRRRQARKKLQREDTTSVLHPTKGNRLLSTKKIMNSGDKGFMNSMFYGVLQRAQLALMPKVAQPIPPHYEGEKPEGLNEQA